MSRMLLNVIHRADGGAELLSILKFQEAAAHEHGLKTTILVTYAALFDEETMEYVQSQMIKDDVEIGIHFHGLVCDDYVQRFGTCEPAIYLLPFQLRKKVIQFIFDKFHSVFGFMPMSLGSYILDANTLRFIKKRYPSVKVSIISCFEEGINMYRGNNRQWYLFSDGGPWGIYYPARHCHLCPAKNEEDAIGIVGLPHLNRDMVLSLTNRDDLFSSHPMNLVRAMANDGASCNYMLHFIDQWIEQLQYNPVVYYSLFVSTSWMAENNPFVENSLDAKKLYDQSLSYLKNRQDQGLVQSMTMSETGGWYLENVRYDQPEVNLWQDILFGSKRQTFWYADAYFRAAVDLNAGGAIVDLRPYTGQVDKNMGPDTKNLWNGNYPFIISSEHRGGIYAGPVHTCEAVYQGKVASLLDERTKGHISRSEGGKPQLVTEPLTIQLGDLSFQIISVFRFQGEGVIEIERQVGMASNPDAEIELIETHRGCWGTNEYPENLQGITLKGEDQSGELRSLDYAYQSRSIWIDGPWKISAILPQINCQVSLVPIGPADQGELVEGHMFRPFYTLRMHKKVKLGGSLITCLILEKI